MTRREARDLWDQDNRLMHLGISSAHTAQLHRISMTLRRWFERECGTDNGCIERDETTNKTYWLNSTTMRRWPIPDRETGARKRLAAIMAQYPTLTAYIQGDPRGCALYILRPEDLAGEHAIDAIYTRGVAVA